MKETGSSAEANGATRPGPDGTQDLVADRTNHRGREVELRHTLGIPDDAQKVLVLAESSHWDPNWMLKADEYFRLTVRGGLDRVLEELGRAPRRVWNADCTFFLAMYWDARPDRRDELVGLVNSGRVRLTTSGVTTQDTLLPSTESVLRDFLVGQEWLRARGMTQEPRLAYFPDSFGHSPTLPSLLRAAGFDRTVVTRIAGGYFVGAEWEGSGNYPKAGTSAETLTNSGSADFVWRDGHGAEVLAHWHAFTYAQGDLLASFGIRPLAIPDRFERRVAARLERYAAKLGTLARTPYLLCPIGGDFQYPIPNLIDLIDRYNETRFGDSGLWVVNAATDDYLDLVDTHRDQLPVHEFDPNPYWTGFYASRPELKRSHRRLVDRLITAEADAVSLGVTEAARRTNVWADAWWVASVGNHHDFVTGTSPDRVVRGEQEPWLRDAFAAVDRIAGGGFLARPPARATGEATDTEPAPVRLTWEHGRLRADAGRLVAVFDPGLGGCATSIQIDGVETVAAPAGDLIAYADSGGLWRIGSEYRGGHLRPVDRTSDHHGFVTATAHSDGTAIVQVRTRLDGYETLRTFELAPGMPGIAVRTRCAAADRRTVTLTVPLTSTPGSLLMDQPGGVVSRPLQRVFDPTFWPVASWLVTEGTKQPLSVGVEMTRAVTVRPDGTLEVIVARNAVQERAWRFVPILACPARGHERGETDAAVALHWGASSAAWAQGWRAAAMVEDPVRRQFAEATTKVLRLHDDSESVGNVPGTDPPPVVVLALKAADRGDGFVVRLADQTGSDTIRTAVRTVMPLERALMCDVRERDLHPLEVRPHGEGSEVVVDATVGIVSIRLIPSASA